MKISKKQILLFCSLLVFLAAISGVLFKSCLVQKKKLNVVWILVDALRADHLTPYNYTRDTSPFLNKFAQDHIMFKYAFSQESYTQASVATLFTSTYPWIHRDLYNQPTMDVIDPHLVTIAKIFKDAQYNTAAFLCNPNIQRKFNFQQGFDVYDDNVAPFNHPDETYTTPEVHETAKKIYDKVENYLEGVGNKRPVFLYLHYRDVHFPYLPLPPYDNLFSAPMDYVPSREEAELDRKYNEYNISNYDEEIRYTDDYLEKTLRMLEAHGINQSNSIIIIMADHGEEFYDPHPLDPGGGLHNRTLYNELIHVPLLISLPGAGRATIESNVGLIDIAPTLCEVMGIDWRRYDQFQGRSLLSLINGTDRTSSAIYGGGKYERRYIIKDGYKYYIDLKEKTQNRERPSGDPQIMREELYDLKEDFKETKDLISERPEVAAKLREELKSFTKRPVRYQGNGGSIDIDAKTKEELKSLGYLQ